MHNRWPTALFKVAELSPEQLRRRHWEMLAIAACVAIGSLCLEVQGAEQVALRGVPAARLPELCGARALFGVNCPGCGLTRSFLQLARGRLRESWEMHRLGWLLAGLLLAQIPYRIIAICQPRRQLLPRWLAHGIAYGLIIAFIANWLCQLAGV